MCSLQSINMAAEVSRAEDECCTMYIITPGHPEDQAGVFQWVCGVWALPERTSGTTYLLLATCGSLYGLCRDSRPQWSGYKSSNSTILAQDILHYQKTPVSTPLPPGGLVSNVFRPCMYSGWQSTVLPNLFLHVCHTYMFQTIIIIILILGKDNLSKYKMQFLNDHLFC